MADNALDDAAAAALWKVRNEPRENVGLLYGDEPQSTPTVRGRESTFKGAFSIPAGSLRGLFHNHPPSGSREKFSKEDKAQAKALNTKSYIAAGDAFYSYDPKTGRVEEVLAQFPMDAIPARKGVMASATQAAEGQARIDAAREARIQEYNSGTIAGVPPKQ